MYNFTLLLSTNNFPDILDTLITKKLGTDCDDDKSRYGKNIL